MLRKGLFISDRYEVTDKIGSGGMSDVYKAKDHKLNRLIRILLQNSELKHSLQHVYSTQILLMFSM